MKFLHIGDLHLGKSLLEFDLIDDQRFILDRLLDLAKKEAVDAVLIAGDVYDKAIPSEAAVNLLNVFLSSLADMKIKVFMISGNHDSDDRLNFGSSLFESNQIYISSVFDGRLRKYTAEDEWGEVDIFLLPFVKASQVRQRYPGTDIRSYDDAVRVVLKEAMGERGDDKNAGCVQADENEGTGQAGDKNSGCVQADENEGTGQTGDIIKVRHEEAWAVNRRRVIVAHQFVAGKSQDPFFAGSESIGARSVGLVEKVGYDCFDAFDYVALGHIHSPQKVGRDEVRYSGSPLKYSLNEADNEKTVPLVTLGRKGGVKIELVPLVPKRDMRHLRGELRELLNKEKLKAQDDYIYATLTDEDFIPEAMGIFRQFYPNTLKIDYDNARTRQVQQVDISNITDNKSFPELIGDFYKLMYGCEISGEEMDVMISAAKEAGVIHEAD